ncbi:hypothetical protein [Pseudomonas fluorescens]|uniref:Uncharacterized protein n=1 Tax=Pseudomonas fluorescens TaxID=294 RepID=A0A5E7FW46_PSEFL|nr:hypothetical protein [Pseudomonas fluorescens]VVO43901.1 hypothetical protein PS710_06303 [Pseudomonas fluorescens]
MLLARIAYQHGDRPGGMRYLADLDQLGRIAGSTRILCSTWLERARVATLEKRLDTADHAMRSAEQLSDWDQPGVVMTANDVDTPFIARQRLAAWVMWVPTQSSSEGVSKLKDSGVSVRRKSSIRWTTRKPPC